jgi:hypothetical protein
MVASLGCGHEDEQMAVATSLLILATVIASPVFLWRSCRRGGSFSRRMGVTVLALSLFAITHLASSPMAAEPGEFFVKSVVEKKLKELPPGPLYWRIENFPTLDEAQTAADASPTSLAAEVSGKFWLFTLGPKGGAPRGAEVAEVGPVPRVTADEYLLRINHAGGPPGSKTPVHSHPGSETFYVLAGQVGQRTPHGVTHTDAGQSLVGHGGDMPMEVFSSGTTDLDQLVMFLLDATRPSSVPAQF